MLNKTRISDGIPKVDGMFAGHARADL